MGCIYFRRSRVGLFCIILFFVSLLSGCVYEGPTASEQEVDLYRRDLVARAVRYRVSLWERVASVGYRLIKALPHKFYRGNFSYLGLIIADSDEQIRMAYDLPEGRFPVVCAKVEGTFAEKLDILPGSILLKIDNYPVHSYREVKEILDYFPPDTFVELTLWKGREYRRMVHLNWMPVKVDFYMSSDAQINAMATPEAVVVTYGMMRFIQTDDELAIVLGHELAHIMLSHHTRGQEVNLVTGLLGAVIGAKLEEVLPGLGGPIVRMGAGAVQSGFSRDLERQADYWGLYFAYRAGYDIDAGKDIWERFAVEVPESMIKDFWATHPSSVERRVYIEKIVNQLKQGIFPDDGD